MDVYIDNAGLHVSGRIIPMDETCDGPCKGAVTHVGEFRIFAATDAEITGCMLLCEFCVTMVDDPGVTVTPISELTRQATEHERKVKPVTIERLNLLREWVKAQQRVSITQAATFLDVHLSVASALLRDLQKDGFLQRKMVRGMAEYSA